MRPRPVRRRWAATSAIAALWAVALLCLAMPSPAGAETKRYWGAQIGPHLTGTDAPWDMNAVTSFEGLAKKQVSLVHFSSPFANCSSSPCWFVPFPTSLFEDVRRRGAIPFFSWASQSTPSNLNQPEFQLSDVIAGAHDSYIRSWATAAKNWGKPFFLRFNFEMNGSWFPWSEGVNGNQPGESVAAWRHVHDIFKSVGATNASWVWCPYVDPRNTLQPLSPLYPGDAYVDWTCLDGYNWGKHPRSPTQVWRSFDFLFGPSYRQIVDTIAPSKPMVIGEIGSTEIGGSKSGWIHNLFMHLSTGYPKVAGLVWLEVYADGMDWPIETSSTALSSFVSGIGNRAYLTNKYSRISGRPIPAPR